MAGELNGSLVLLLLKVLGQWRLIGGQVSMTDTIAAAPIDITNKSSQDYRELLEGEGLLTRDITLEIYYNSDINYQRLRSLADSGQQAEFRILRSGTAINDDVTAMISSFSEVCPMSDRVSNTITLSGTRFSNAGPTPPIITQPPDSVSPSVNEKILFTSKAINWKTVQWFIQRGEDGTGVTPPREEITGANEPDLNYTIMADDFGSSLIVVYSNDFGTAEAEATIGIQVNPAATSLLYPIVSGEMTTANYDKNSLLLEDGLLPQLLNERASSNYGVNTVLLRNVIIEHQSNGESCGVNNYGVESLFMRNVLITQQAPNEEATINQYSINSMLLRDVVVDVLTSESSSANYGITSMVIT